jgi:hypothetical protein
VQYWRSFDHLEAYARDRNALHWPAWVEYRGGDGLYAFAGFIRCGSWVKRNIKNRQLS